MPRGERVGAGRQAVGLVELEDAVDLVDEEMCARFGGDRGEAVEGGAVGQHPGRVVRQVDDDEPRRRRDLAAEAVEVERPAVGLVQLVERDVGAGRSRDLVQALVARPGHDGVIARAEEHVRQAEDGLLGAGEGEDLVGLDRVVQRRDLAPQERMAGRLRVAQPRPSHSARVSSSARASRSAIG